jgi:hypothetical protein
MELGIAPRLAVLLVVALAAGCAAEVVRQPTTLTPLATGAERPQRELAEEAVVPVSSNYSRVLPRGSRWQLVGTVPQGGVYRRADGIFTVEGAHVHEAYLVIAGEKLVGFYLPVEKSYAPASPVVLKLN